MGIHTPFSSNIKKHNSTKNSTNDCNDKSQTFSDIFYCTNSTNVLERSDKPVLNYGPDNALVSEQIFTRLPEISTAIRKTHCPYTIVLTNEIITRLLSRKRRKTTKTKLTLIIELKP